MHTLSDLTAHLRERAAGSWQLATADALALIESAVLRPHIPDAATVAEIRLILLALDAASRPAAPDLHDTLTSMEDAATGREHDAEAQAEVDAERTAQPRAEDISADLATDLRAEADSPSELAAIELLIGVDLHEHPAIVRRIGTVSRIAVDWHALAADLDGDAVRDVTTDQQFIVLPLACSLGAGVGVSLSTVLGAVRRRPDPADRDALTGLVLGAVRIALTATRPAVTR
ncbi:hypothetical protein EDC02_5905 [Micromonospora sp. Llam0]|uniref:hypothetical protein n=1 Tax=Micromonospora sp. Llam0 TaxID=2485143 RepID=UPI000F4979BD|nr:hypothetical protein [Micromonospora sp. Llam0]ROO51041.1 hypothetical protein EDC02_5905 [Micromonospora sp. Llam0]